MRKWGEINTERENVTQLGRVSNAMQRNLMPWSSEWELHSSGVHLVTVTRKQSTLSIKRTVIFSQKLEHIFLVKLFRSTETLLLPISMLHYIYHEGTWKHFWGKNGVKN